MSSQKNPERVAAGLKAALHNPTVSDTAKEHAREHLHEMGADNTDKNPERVIAGLKATLHNSAVSGDAKESARQRLRTMGVDPDAKMEASPSEEYPKSHRTHESGESAVDTEKFRHSKGDHVHAVDEGEEHRKLGGYKATLKNPHASPEAKEHAREILKDHGIEI